VTAVPSGVPHTLSHAHALTLADNCRALADAQSYAIRLEAEANQMLFTKEYLERELYRSVANNTKIYYGEKIPQVGSCWTLLRTPSLSL
jgi:hypothetical protein